jgi:hypothetical protein
MLTESQRKQVANLIFLQLGLTPSPATIQALVGLEAARTAPAGANAYQIAVWLLDYTLNLPQPDLFIQVVSAVDAQQELLEVQELLLRLHEDASLWQTQALDELWVPPQWPFADRSELRKVLFAMAQGNGPAAITIEAPQGHGKRTMCAYIERLAARQGSFRPVAVHLRREPSPGALDALVADLRIGLELELPKPGTGDATTHVEAERRAFVSALTLAQELAREAVFAPSATWLIANVIDGAGLEAGVLRFLDELLGQVQETPAALRRLRVVLLSDDVAGLELTHLPDLKARYVLPEVDEDAITQWLAAVVPGKPPQLYSVATSTVLAQVNQMRVAPSERLAWLARHCVSAHRTLARIP